MDNYEWQAAYSSDARFGLYSVDRNSNNLDRTATRGLEAFQYIIRESRDGAIDDLALSKGQEVYGTYSPDGSNLISPVSSVSNQVSAQTFVLVSPTCGPPNFDIAINANGFKPESNVAWKLVDEEQKVPLQLVQLVSYFLWGILVAWQIVHI